MDSRVWLSGLICCLLGGGIRAEEFAVIKGKIGGKVPAREVQLMTVENGVPVKRTSICLPDRKRSTCLRT